MLKANDAELAAPIDTATLQTWLQNNCS
ncbi:MAG: hypothetical protein ACI883_001334 [Candidatus Azotimanducaceae bacterium]